MRTARYTASMILVLAFVGTTWLAAQTSVPRAKRRARLPDLGSPLVADPFFKDAFTEALTGDRPANFGTLPQSPPTTRPDTEGGQVDGESSGYAWSKIISASTIEDEVKRMKLELDKSVTTPGRFKAGDYRKCQRSFTVLGLMFAIIAEYDGDVRWRDQARIARDRFGRAGLNAKVGTSQTYDEAKARHVELQDLIQGARISGNRPNEEFSWDQICDRVPLMERLEQARQERLKQWIANRSLFTNNRDNIRHEAEVIAAIFEAIQNEGFEFWDDDQYLDYCKQMKQYSRDIVEAVDLGNYESTRKAVGNIEKTCSQCHEDFRG